MVGPMRLTRADVLALLIALGAAIAGGVVWANGTVTLGLTLDDDGETVAVFDVTPGGLADRNRFEPGMTIIDLATTDGSEVERGEPIDFTEGSLYLDYGASEYGWSFPWSSVGGPLREPPDEIRLPTEAVESSRIAAAVGGYYSPEDRYLETTAWIEIFDNTQDIPSLAAQVRERMHDAAEPLQYGYLIRRHGLYTWGRDLGEARRHVEIFEFLFECVARRMILTGELKSNAVA